MFLECGRLIKDLMKSKISTFYFDDLANVMCAVRIKKKKGSKIIAIVK